MRIVLAVLILLAVGNNLRAQDCLQTCQASRQCLQSYTFKSKKQIELLVTKCVSGCQAQYSTEIQACAIPSISMRQCLNMANCMDSIKKKPLYSSR